MPGKVAGRYPLGHQSIGSSMRRLVQILLSIVPLATLTPAGRCEEPGDPSLRPGLLGRQEMVLLRVIGGRIEAAVFGEGQCSEGVGPRHEQLTVNTVDAAARVEYNLVSPQQELSMVLSGDQRVVIRSEWFLVPPQEGSPKRGAAERQKPIRTAEYRQTPRGVTLVVTEMEETHSAEGRSLWHLLITEPELCRRNMAPIFDLLRPQWRLMDTAQAARAALLRIALFQRHAEQPRWETLVAKLADRRFALRQQAERELRAAGEASLPYLESLDRRDLDAEQWRRVSEIVASYEADGEDAPERIAARLSADRSVWIGLLADENESTRTAAADQLTVLCGAAVDFDPAAAPDARARQIAALRAKLLRQR